MKVSLVLWMLNERRSEKTASGTARVMEKSQITAARRTILAGALEAWMSMGFTIALYLEDDRGGGGRRDLLNLGHLFRSMCDV